MLSFRANTRLLAGLTAAAGAFGVAAMMSAATAHADAFGDIVSDVQTDTTIGQEDFGSAFSYFSGGSAVDDYLGLEYFLSGVTNEFVLPSDQVIVGTAEVLSNQPVNDLPTVEYEGGVFGVPNIASPPLDLTTAAADAQTAIADGQSYLAEAATLFSSGDYGDAAIYDVVGTYALADLPTDLLIGGGVAELLGIL
jgi:hypothetical protein